MKPLLHPTTLAELDKLAQTNPEFLRRIENALRALLGLEPLTAGVTADRKASFEVLLLWGAEALLQPLAAPERLSGLAEGATHTLRPAVCDVIRRDGRVLVVAPTE